MSKLAHIIPNADEVDLGDRVLAVCGKDFKYKTRWEDMPLDKPICRKCLDLVVRAFTQLDNLVAVARINAFMVERVVQRLTDSLDGNGELIADQIQDDLAFWKKAEREVQEAKEQEQKRQQTCTCSWSTPELFVVDLDCPIHADGEFNLPDVPEEEEN